LRFLGPKKAEVSLITAQNEKTLPPQKITDLRVNIRRIGGEGDQPTKIEKIKAFAEIILGRL